MFETEARSDRRLQFQGLSEPLNFNDIEPDFQGLPASADSSSLQRGVRIIAVLVGRGMGSYALSSLNRLTNSRSASTGSSGSVISNGGRVSRTASNGMEPSSE